MRLRYKFCHHKWKINHQIQKKNMLHCIFVFSIFSNNFLLLDLFIFFLFWQTTFSHTLGFFCQLYNYLKFFLASFFTFSKFRTKPEFWSSYSAILWANIGLYPHQAFINFILKVISFKEKSRTKARISNQHVRIFIWKNSLNRNLNIVYIKIHSLFPNTYR